MKTQHRMRTTIVIALLVGHLSAGAATVGGVNIHGFGGWSYGKTDSENRYLAANKDGNYDAVNFSLNISANPSENLSLHIQPGFAEDLDGSEVGLDYAFAEVVFSDAAILRVGKIKVPFMLYTEVYKVGTIRPFFALPQSVYSEVTVEAYKGLGLTGSLYASRNWEILYDVYGGQISLQPTRIPSIEDGQITLHALNGSAKEMFGGRLHVHTPIEGFSFGTSSYVGDFEFSVDGYLVEDYPVAGRTIFIGAFAEYLSDRWWVRSEAVTSRENPAASEDIVYGEAAYKLTSHWQLAARYEYMQMDVTAPEIQYLPKSGNRHKEAAFGLNYWFNPSFVVKLSYHVINGNRFANPDQLEDFLAVLMNQEYDETTQCIMVGVQFSF